MNEKVPNSARLSNYADVVIGYMMTPHDNALYLGQGGDRWAYVCSGIATSSVVAHEVGHCCSLVNPGEPNYDSDHPPHCKDSLCIMYYSQQWQFYFCSDCVSEMKLPSRDYAFPDASLESNPGDSTTSNPGFWKVSQNAIPDGWWIEILIDGIEQGETQVSEGYSNNYNVPASVGTHTIEMYVHDWGLNCIKYYSNAITINSGSSGSGGLSIFSDIAIVLVLPTMVAISFVEYKRLKVKLKNFF